MTDIGPFLTYAFKLTLIFMNITNLGLILTMCNMNQNFSYQCYNFFLLLILSKGSNSKKLAGIYTCPSVLIAYIDFEICTSLK